LKIRGADHSFSSLVSSAKR